MKRIALAAAIAAACTSSAFSAGAERTIAGQAQVIDGDSLVVSGVRIRILDVDAPESGQFCFAKGESVDQGAWHCGKRAAAALSDWIGEQKISCDTTGQGIPQGLAGALFGRRRGPGAVARGQRLGGACAGLQVRGRAIRRGSGEDGGAGHLVQRLHDAVGVARGALAAFRPIKKQPDHEAVDPCAVAAARHDQAPHRQVRAIGRDELVSKDVVLRRFAAFDRVDIRCDRWSDSAQAGSHRRETCR